MKEKNLFDILENAETDSMERLIEKCPEISDEQLDKIFRMSEKKFRNQRAEKERTKRDKTIKMTEGDVVEGVERSKRPAWLTPLSTAASVLLIAGIAVGSTIMLKRNTKPIDGGGGVAPAVTATTTTVTGTGTNIVSTDKNGSTVTRTGTATTTTAASAVTAASAGGSEDKTENTSDTDFIKPFVGRWRYEMSSINNLDIPESVEYMGTVEIADDASYVKTDNSGNVTHGTISNAVEEIGGTRIQCLDFSVNEYSANDFLFNRAYYVESRPYELHFGNSNIARLVREEHVEPVDTSWKAAYRKELLYYFNRPGTIFNDPMWDLQDLDGDGTPEFLFSTGESETDFIYIYYYDTGDAVPFHDTYTVDSHGAYGNAGFCKEEHLIGWQKSFDNYHQTVMVKFENNKKKEEYYAYDPDSASYGGNPYTLNGFGISKEEYDKAINRYNSKNWTPIGRKYQIQNFSPLLDN